MPHIGGPGGGAGVTTFGAQPLSIAVSGAIAIEYAQGEPPQSLPAGIAFIEVHAPVHSAGGSKDVGAPVQRIWLSAVIVAGSAQEPSAGSHEQDPHAKEGAVRSA